MAVHHVDVQQVRLGLDPIDVGGELREVGGQDRRGELHDPDPIDLVATTNIPSVPAACGSSFAPRPNGRHGGPGGASARRWGNASAIHSSISTVSARVSVHTEYTRRPPGRTSGTAAAINCRCSAAS